MTRNLPTASLTLAAALLLPNSALAETDTIDWKAVMSDIDGVVVYCQATTRESYAAQICDAASKATETELKADGLPVSLTGIVYTGSAAKDGEPSDPDAARGANEFARPLYIRFHIKGTDDNNPAIYLGTRASIPFTAATEAGSDAPGKAGELVVYEQDTVANGPRKKLANFLAKYLADKAKELGGGIRSGI